MEFENMIGGQSMNEIIRFKKEDTILVVIDMQEKLMPAMYNREKTEEQNIRLAKGMKVLGVPVIVTTQYAKGLGKTIDSMEEVLEGCPILDKFTFSAYRNEEFRKTLEASGRKTVVITGVESHVCVQQTAMDLIEAGYKVAIAMDCVSSRSEESLKTAAWTLSSAGALLTCAESILFELLESAKAPEFKQISAIVK
jgi:nicotinamidase-related amidase